MDFLTKSMKIDQNAPSARNPDSVGLAQLAKDSMQVDEPEGTVGYAAACTVAFTLLMVVIARLWVKVTPEDDGEGAEEADA